MVNLPGAGGVPNAGQFMPPMPPGMNMGMTPMGPMPMMGMPGKGMPQGGSPVNYTPSAPPNMVRPQGMPAAPEQALLQQSYNRDPFGLRAPTVEFPLLPDYLVAKTQNGSAAQGGPGAARPIPPMWGGGLARLMMNPGAFRRE